MLFCVSWPYSTWDSIRHWIDKNKFVTVVQVFTVGLLIFGVVIVWQNWGWIVTESGSTIIRNLGLVVGGLIAIGFGIWRGVVASRQAKTSQRGLLNERYQKASEMLGSEVLAVRLGGIYALQSLAEDEPEQYHVQIMRLLCAFVRHPTTDEAAARMPTLNPSIKTVRQDVQAALWVITGRGEGIANVRLDLMGANLPYAQLAGANLTDALLLNVNLTGAILAQVKGLTQGQLDLACADPGNPPQLGGLCDGETGKPLKWRGPPCRKPVTTK